MRGVGCPGASGSPDLGALAVTWAGRGRKLTAALGPPWAPVRPDAGAWVATGVCLRRRVGGRLAYEPRAGFKRKGHL